jgi:hypothetical protein
MMMNAEHLIETAVTALELHDPYDAYSIFMYNPRNAEMAALAGVSLDAVWEMAQYCYTTLRQDWKEKWEKEAETQGDIERERIEAILKKHGTYILSTIDGQGCHVGCYKGIALDADANWIIEAEVESMSETNCGDFIPVVHGYWINTPPYRAVNGMYKKAQECSVCDAFYVSDGYAPYSNHPYCAECGAKMDGPVRRWTEENDGKNEF